MCPFAHTYRFANTSAAHQPTDFQRDLSIRSLESLFCQTVSVLLAKGSRNKWADPPKPSLARSQPHRSNANAPNNMPAFVTEAIIFTIISGEHNPPISMKGTTSISSDQKLRPGLRINQKNRKTTTASVSCVATTNTCSGSNIAFESAGFAIEPPQLLQRNRAANVEISRQWKSDSVYGGKQPLDVICIFA